MDWNSCLIGFVAGCWFMCGVAWLKCKQLQRRYELMDVSKEES